MRNLQSYAMHPGRIAELLHPFLTTDVELAKGATATKLSPTQLENISTYIDILLRWNAHVNLTSVRTPEEIVTRHFGESLFAARNLFPVPNGKGLQLIDVGSGGGFPGLPIKLWAPRNRLTLIESNRKKVTFLREIIRALKLTDAEVFPPAGRKSSIQPVRRRADGHVPRSRAFRLDPPLGDNFVQAIRSSGDLHWQRPD